MVPKMRERVLHLLKHRGPGQILKRLEGLPTELLARDGIREHVGYLRKREEQMQYPVFLKEGLPIGSGMVESANKLVVEARLKGAGMRWARKNVNAILTLRNGGVVIDGKRRGKKRKWLSKQRTRHRQDAAQHHVEKRLLRHNPLLLTSPSSPPLPPPTPDPLPAAPAVQIRSGSSHPSAHHPWRRPFKPGQTRAQKDGAKM